MTKLNNQSKQELEKLSKQENEITAKKQSNEKVLESSKESKNKAEAEVALLKAGKLTMFDKLQHIGNLNDNLEINIKAATDNLRQK